VSVVYINGEFLEEREATISPFDRGFLYGDGVFETIKVSEGRIWFLAAHLERLRASCAFLRIPLDSLRDAELPRTQAAISQLLATNDLEGDEVAVRITITRGLHTGRLDLEEGSLPTIIITARPYSPPASKEDGKGLCLTFCRDFVQNEQGPLFPHKSLNYLFYLLVHDRARRAGFDDGIILNREGNVCECATSNLFIVEKRRSRKEPRVRTPALHCGLLGGIVRAKLLCALHTAGIEVNEGVITPAEILCAGEVFCTNSLIEIKPVSRVEEKENSGREMTGRIIAIFEDHKSRMG